LKFRALSRNRKSRKSDKKLLQKMPENQLLLRFLRRRYSLEKIYSFQQYTHEINEP